MKLEIEGIRDNAIIPEKFCFGIKDPEQHMQLGENRNPAIRWSDLPDGTRSLVLICVDPDVPAVADDVNMEGKTLPAGMERVDFHHWLMVDINPDLGEIPEASCSDGVTPKGKSNPPGPKGSRQGLNDYTGFMAGNPDMAGEYFGYDGPCPPWNDERPHRYRFRLIATSLAEVPVKDGFRGPDVEAAIKGYVLAEASITARYSLNPAVEL